MESVGKICPGEVWLDTNGVAINAHGGGMLFHEQVFYWFGEHKVEGEEGNRAQVGVHVYRSTDLMRWEDAGIALKVSEDPESPITKGCILERPKVLFCARTGKFVMWFHLEPRGKGYAGARSGVAVAERVTGPYRFVEAFRPNAGVWPENVEEALRRPLSEEETARYAEMDLNGAPRPYYPKHALFRRDFSGGQMARDMTLFLDDDRQAYHVYASEGNGTLHISLLSEDFLRPAGRYIRIFPGRFHEAPALMKHRGRYYLWTSDCTGWTPNTARLSAAESIWGPWEELGNPCWGTGAQIVNTFESQPTYIVPVPGKGFVYMGDRWRPRNAIDGRYVWLPIVFKHGVPMIEWRERWSFDDLP